MKIPNGMERDRLRAQRDRLRSSALRLLELLVVCAPDENVNCALQVMERDVSEWRKAVEL